MNPLVRSIMRKTSERLSGGLADDEKPQKYDSRELDKGVDVEYEHTDDQEVAREIAMDHLEEIPDYYTRLHQMEEEAEEDAEGGESKVVLLIQSVANKGRDLTSDGDEAVVPPKDLTDKAFIPASELQADPDEDMKKAQAFEAGLRFNLAEHGIVGVRQDLAVKVAADIASGRVKTALDVRQSVKTAADEWESGVQSIGDWITEETRLLSPAAKLMLLTLGGAGIGAGAGALGDKALETVGRQPSNALAVLGALTGGGMGAYKYVKDRSGPVPGVEGRSTLLALAE